MPKLPPIPEIKSNPFRNLRMMAGDQKRSVSWYQQTIKQLGDVNHKVERRLVGHQRGLTRTLTPGNLYIFKYDAKWKDELPYWDKLPLVFPFRKLDDGFLGINLHYLPLNLRVKLMEALIDIENSNTNPDKKAEVSWQLLKSSAKYNGVKPCVKRYLKHHIRTRFMMIPRDQWISAAMLPIEQFQKATKTKVWSDSRRMMK